MKNVTLVSGLGSDDGYRKGTAVAESEGEMKVRNQVGAMVGSWYGTSRQVPFAQSQESMKSPA